ncbi:MAG: elongation factor 1-beta [Candidatus Bathyarchaeia archaeon]|nr:elongation factor 1-beta [Candidatus Bathyarchaeota archaeon]
MGRVMASIRIFPSDPSCDLSGLRSEIVNRLPKDVSVLGFREDPIAFGLVALIVNLTMPENVDGVMDGVEEVLRSIEGVSEIQVLALTRT